MGEKSAWKRLSDSELRLSAVCCERDEARAESTRLREENEALLEGLEQLRLAAGKVGGVLYDLHTEGKLTREQREVWYAFNLETARVDEILERIRAARGEKANGT